jgi:putative copper export protein/methionine-rich copper-binding protein CopC
MQNTALRRNTRRKRYLRLLLGLLAGLSILLAWNWLPVFSQPPVAQAHAFVIGSDPVDGTTIQSAPAVVRIYFNGDISPASRAQVFVFTPGGPPDGREVDRGTSIIPAAHPRELDTPLLSPSTLPQGSYEVRWTALASNDGTASHGLIGFNVGFSVTGLSGTPIIGPSTSNILPQMNLQGILATLWDWVTLLALTAWIGLVMLEAVFVFGVVPTMGSAAENALRLLRKQTHPLQWLCLSALLAAEIIDLVLRGIIFSQFQPGAGVGINLADVLAILLQTSYGYLWLARLGLIGCALVFAWWTTRAAQTTRTSRKRQAIHAMRGQLKSEAAQRTTPTPSPQASSSTPYRQLRLQIEDEPAQNEDSDGDARDNEQNGQPERADQEPGWNPPAYRTSAAVATAGADGVPAISTSVSRRHAVSWLLLAALIVLTIAFSSDTVQLAQAHITAIVLSWLQMLALAAWVGGIACLGFVLLPMLPTIEPETQGALVVNVLRACIPLLLVSLGILLLSGLFSFETTITSADQLLNDPYGRTLLVAILLFLLLLFFTAYSFLRLLPAMRRQVILLPVVNADLPARRARRSALEQSISSLKRAMHILAALGAAILLCIALMGFYAPPLVFPALPATSGSATGTTPGTSTAQSVQTRTTGNLVISLQVSPARVNTTNTVSVTLKDTSGKAITNARVLFQTNMQLMNMGVASKTVQGQGNSSNYAASFAPDEAFSMDGTWVIYLTIQQPGHQLVQTQFFVTLTS